MSISIYFLNLWIIVTSLLLSNKISEQFVTLIPLFSFSYILDGIINVKNSYIRYRVNEFDSHIYNLLCNNSANMENLAYKGKNELLLCCNSTFHNNGRLVLQSCKFFVSILLRAILILHTLRLFQFVKQWKQETMPQKLTLTTIVEKTR